MSYENYLIREMVDGDLYPGDTTCSDCNEIICSCDAERTVPADRPTAIKINQPYVPSPGLRHRAAAWGSETTTCRGCGVDLSRHGHAPECENLPEPSQG